MPEGAGAARHAASAPSAFPRRIELWRIDLDAGETEESLLSPDERERAARFVFERDRRRYIRGRVGLRRHLAARLGERPERLCFTYNPCGKPRLAGRDDLAFNLSHSGAACILALSNGAEIGVDLERVGAFEAAVAAEAFSPRECLEIMRLPAAERGLAFARCWTRKEAFIKAIGLGFSYPSHEVIVTLGLEARILACRPEAGRAADWRLLPFDPGPGFVGAVAVRGEAEVCWGER